MLFRSINTTGNLISLNGTLCYGGVYSINVPASGEGATSCLKQYSQTQIDDYANIGLTLTPGITPCGNSCIPPTTTSTTTPAPTTTTTTTPAPTTTTTTTGSGAFTGCITWTNVEYSTSQVPCGENSGTNVYYRLTAYLYELDGVTPKNAPIGGLAVTFDASGSGPCIPSGGTYTVTIPVNNSSAIGDYTQTDYTDCGYGCGYNTYNVFQFAYTNYPGVGECGV